LVGCAQWIDGLAAIEPMNKCKAYYPIAGRDGLDSVCAEARRNRDMPAHGDAIFGAMLGAIVYEKAVDEAVEVEAESGRDSSESERRDNAENAEVRGERKQEEMQRPDRVG